MANTLAQLLGARIAVYNATHPKAPLDPRAVMGIASHEGLGGGIGDNGTSYGPFQLHLGGAYPAFAPHGNAAQDQAWAASAPGIDYALGQIGNVAGGLRGINAITNISTRFERPANPQAEIQDAAAHYGLPLPQLASGGLPAAWGEPGKPKGGPPPTGLIGGGRPNLPNPGLLASLMGGGSAPIQVAPIDVTPSAPQPLPGMLSPIQIPRVPYQPVLAGGH